MTVRTEEGERVKFNFFPEQQYIYGVYKLLKDPKRNAPVMMRIYKSRRRGASTMFVLDLLHKVLFSGLEVHGQIYGHEKDSGSALFTMLRTFYENVPQHLTQKLRSSQDRKWQFANNSEILVKTIQGEGLSRGSATNYMLMTEVGMYRQAKKINEVLSGLTQTPRLTIIQESTSNGYDDYWYESHLHFDALVQHLAKTKAGQYKRPTREQELRGYTTALALLRAGLWPRSEFFHIFIPWFWNAQNYSDDAEWIAEVSETLTDYEKDIKELYNLTNEQIAWYRARLRFVNNDELMLKQEYPCSVEESFVAKNKSLFNTEILSRYISRVQRLPDIYTRAQEEQTTADEYIKKLNTTKEFPKNTLVSCDLKYEKPPREVGHMRFLDRDKAQVVPVINNMGTWIVYNPPVKGYQNRYVIACDPAEGKENSDTTTMIVFDRLLKKFPAVGFGKINVEDTAVELAKVGAWYNFAPILVERNGPGQTVLLGLSPRYIKVMSASSTTKGYDEFNVSELGIYMSNTRGQGTKFRAANLLKDFIEVEVSQDSDGSELPFTQVLMEMGTFDGETLKAIGKKKDDFVLVAMIALEADRLLSAQGLHPKQLNVIDAPKVRFIHDESSAPSSRCF